MPENSAARTTVIVALIGLAGVLTTAVLTNWDKVFKGPSASNVANNSASLAYTPSPTPTLSPSPTPPANVNANNNAPPSPLAYPTVRVKVDVDVTVEVIDPAGNNIASSLPVKIHLNGQRLSGSHVVFQGVKCGTDYYIVVETGIRGKFQYVAQNIPCTKPVHKIVIPHTLPQDG